MVNSGRDIEKSCASHSNSALKTPMTPSQLTGSSIRDGFRVSTPAFLLIVTMTAVGSLISPSLAAQTQGEREDQIRALMNLSAVRSALEHIEATDDLTVADQITLTQIPAPPFMEEERGICVSVI